MAIDLRLNAGTLASNCWPSDPQTLYNEMMERGSALLGDITGVIKSDSAPDPNDRDKVWFKTNAGAPTTGLGFIFFNGAWVTPHPTPPSSDERRLWVGASADLITYDGGSVGTVGAASGPMWEVDTDFDGRFPVGPGAIAGSSPAVTLAVGDTGGTPQVTLTGANLAPHQHITSVCAIVSQTTDPPSVGSPATVQYGVGKTQGTGSVVDESSSTYARAFPMTSLYPDTTSTTQTPVNTLPNYRAVYFIKRTARVYYVG